MEPFSSPSVPALQLEQISLRGNLLASKEGPTSPRAPSLVLLLSGGSGVAGPEAQSSIRGHLSAQAGIVSVGITEPLMKLSRHLIETYKALSPWKRAASSTSGERKDCGASLSQPSDLWHFSQALVGLLESLQNAPAELSRISFSRPSSAGSVHSRTIRSLITDYSHSPRNICQSSEDSHQLSPQAAPPRSVGLSTDSSSSEAGAGADQATTPTSPASQSPLHTSGGDLPSSDDVHLSSGSHTNRPPSPLVSAGPASANNQRIWIPDVGPLQLVLQTSPTQLSHSLFGLVRIDSVSVALHVETSTSFLRLAGRALSPATRSHLPPLITGVTGSVDSRKLPTYTGSCWPSYLSMVATVKTSQLGISDRTL